MAKTSGRRGWRVFRGCVAASLVLCFGLARAETPATADGIEAVWKTHELHFEYRGGNTFYSCHGLHERLTRILLHLGARKPPELRAYTCNDTTGVARFQVTFESPLEATADNVRELTDYDAREVLIARARGEQSPSAQDLERFPAEWKTVSFSRDRRLNLDPGDCELVQQLRQQILPRMSVQVLRNRRCSTFGNISRPSMTVSALVAEQRQR